MRYIVIPSSEDQPSEERTKSFSRELYRLGKPTPAEGDVTEYLFGFVTHPETGETAMQYDAEELVVIPEQADPTALIGLLNPTEGQTDEIGEIAGRIDASRGSQMPFGDILPSFVETFSREQMESAGWFPQDEE
jgi:hypothetical protein